MKPAWLAAFDKDTPYEPVGWPINGQESQRIICAELACCRDLSAGNPNTFDAFWHKLGQGISRIGVSEPFVWGKSGLSTCGLGAEGALDDTGVDFPWHGKDYVYGSAVTRFINYCCSSKCWQSVFGHASATSLLPDAGSVVVIGARQSKIESYGGIEHELVLITSPDEDGVVWSVEAGHVDPTFNWKEQRSGLQCFALCEQRWAVKSGQVWLRSMDDHTGRLVLGYHNPALMTWSPERIRARQGWQGIDL